MGLNLLLSNVVKAVFVNVGFFSPFLGRSKTIFESIAETLPCLLYVHNIFFLSLLLQQSIFFTGSLPHHLYVDTVVSCIHTKDRTGKHVINAGHAGTFIILHTFASQKIHFPVKVNSWNIACMGEIATEWAYNLQR